MNEKTIKLQVWDTAGQERFGNITTSYYRGSNGIIIVYDVTDRVSFDHVTFWLKEVDRLASPEVVKMIVGNKTDRKEERVVSKQEGQMLAKQYNVGFIETSAFSGRNVEKIFFELTQWKKYKIQLNPKQLPQVLFHSQLQLQNLSKRKDAAKIILF